MPEGEEGKDTQPAHQDVNQGRVVALVFEPDTFVNDTQDGQCPDNAKHRPAFPAPDGNQAIGGVGAGNQDVDHAVVKDLEEVLSLGKDEGVEECRREIEQDEDTAVNRKGHDPHGTSSMSCSDNQKD